MMPRKAEKLIRNLARPLEREASAGILEGIDEILTVTYASACRSRRSPAARTSSRT